MLGEIWTYNATKPSDGTQKVRPVLIILVAMEKMVCSL